MSENFMSVYLLAALENSTYENDFGFNNFSLGDAFWLSTHMFYERFQMKYVRLKVRSLKI